MFPVKVPVYVLNGKPDAVALSKILTLSPGKDPKGKSKEVMSKLITAGLPGGCINQVQLKLLS